MWRKRITRYRETDECIQFFPRQDFILPAQLSWRKSIHAIRLMSKYTYGDIRFILFQQP